MHDAAIDSVDVARNEPATLQVGDCTRNAGFIPSGLGQKIALGGCSIAIEDHEQPEVTSAESERSQGCVERLRRAPVRLTQQ